MRVKGKTSRYSGGTQEGRQGTGTDSMTVEAPQAEGVTASAGLAKPKSTRVRRCSSGILANDITLEQIKQWFHVPCNKAAAKLGVSLTILKRLSRKFGISRWPYRARPTTTMCKVEKEGEEEEDRSDLGEEDGDSDMSDPLSPSSSQPSESLGSDGSGQLPALSRPASREGLPRASGSLLGLASLVAAAASMEALGEAAGQAEVGTPPSYRAMAERVAGASLKDLVVHQHLACSSRSTGTGPCAVAAGPAADPPPPGAAWERRGWAAPAAWADATTAGQPAEPSAAQLLHAYLEEQLAARRTLGASQQGLQRQSPAQGHETGPPPPPPAGGHGGSAEQQQQQQRGLVAQPRQAAAPLGPSPFSAAASTAPLPPSWPAAGPQAGGVGHDPAWEGGGRQEGSWPAPQQYAGSVPGLRAPLCHLPYPRPGAWQVPPQQRQQWAAAGGAAHAGLRGPILPQHTYPRQAAPHDRMPVPGPGPAMPQGPPFTYPPSQPAPTHAVRQYPPGWEPPTPGWHAPAGWQPQQLKPQYSWPGSQATAQPRHSQGAEPSSISLPISHRLAGMGSPGAAAGLPRPQALAGSIPSWEHLFSEMKQQRGADLGALHSLTASFQAAGGGATPATPSLVPAAIAVATRVAGPAAVGPPAESSGIDPAAARLVQGGSPLQPPLPQAAQSQRAAATAAGASAAAPAPPPDLPPPILAAHTRHLLAMLRQGAGFLNELIAGLTAPHCNKAEQQRQQVLAERLCTALCDTSSVVVLSIQQHQDEGMHSGGEGGDKGGGGTLAAAEEGLPPPLPAGL